MNGKERLRQSLELICIGNGQSCGGTAMKRNELALLGKALAARAVRGTAGEWHGSELEMQSLERAWK